jgi:hypothetical protein
VAGVKKGRLIVRPFFFRRVVGFDVLVEDLDKLGYDVITLERGEQAAIDPDRGFGFFEGAGQGNARVACVISLKKEQSSSV